MQRISSFFFSFLSSLSYDFWQKVCATKFMYVFRFSRWKTFHLWNEVKEHKMKKIKSRNEKLFVDAHLRVAPFSVIITLGYFNKTNIFSRYTCEIYCLCAGVYPPNISPVGSHTYQFTVFTNPCETIAFSFLFLSSFHSIYVFIITTPLKRLQIAYKIQIEREKKNPPLNPVWYAWNDTNVGAHRVRV